MALPNEPLTREERYLSAIAGQEVGIPTPITRVEQYLAYIAENGTGGGGGYGGKILGSYDTLAELEEEHPTGSKGDAYLVGTTSIHVYIWVEEDGWTDGGAFAAIEGPQGPKGETGDDGADGVSITGISKISEVGLAKTYRITLSNDTHFDFVVNDGMTPSLTNYYTKSQTEDLIAAIRTLSLEKVETLPTEDIDPLTIYLVRKEDSDVDNDVFDEYLYIDDAWEHIGSTSVNLANYYTKTQTDALLDEKQDVIPSYSTEEYEEYKDDIPVGTIFNLEEDKFVERGEEVYSTSERIIGTWIDDKPLYRKVVTIHPNSRDYSVSHGILYVDLLIRCNGWDGSKYIPSVAFTSSYAEGITATRTNILFNCGQDVSIPSDVIVILEYTKTTD